MLNQISSATNEQAQCKMSIQRLVADTSKKRIGNRLSMKSDRKNFVENVIFSNTDLREKIKNIKCPTLVLLEEYFKKCKPAIEEQYKNLKQPNAIFNKGLHFYNV
jgi:hypothetical protein